MSEAMNPKPRCTPNEPIEGLHHLFYRSSWHKINQYYSVSEKVKKTWIDTYITNLHLKGKKFLGRPRAPFGVELIPWSRLSIGTTYYKLFFY